MEFSTELFAAIAIGLAAQLVDGALGMGYGATCSTLLLNMGLPPALVSATVHASEVATTAVSGTSHAMARNIDRRLFLRLLVPGVIGALLGALFVGNIDGWWLRPVIALYLLAVGVLILGRALRKPPEPREARGVMRLGLFAGFLDAAGGGGWGAVATSNLVAQGVPPRYAVGSVNAAEFFVSVTVVAALVSLVDWSHIEIVGGLIVGGVIAAPFSAFVAKRAPPRAVAIAIGFATIVLNLYGLYRFALV